MFNMTSLKENLAKSSKPNTVKLKWSGKPGKQRSLAQSYSLKKNPFKQKRTHLTREQQHYECALLSDTESKYVWDNFIEKVDMDQNERKTIKTHLRRLSWTDSPSKLTFQLQFHLINESHRKRNVVWTREICEELSFGATWWELKIHLQYISIMIRVVPYLPTQSTLKENPLLTDLFTSWSGKLSNPTWPPSLSWRPSAPCKHAKISKKTYQLLRRRQSTSRSAYSLRFYSNPWPLKPYFVGDYRRLWQLLC